MVNDLVTTFNYGQQELKIITDVIIEPYQYKENKALRKLAIPLLIRRDKHKQLSILIKKYAELFKTYLIPYQDVNRTKLYRLFKRTRTTLVKDEYITEKYDEERGAKCEFKGFKIKQAFLSYLLQNKENVYEQFNYTEVKQIKCYRVCEVYDKFNFTDTYRRSLIDGFYESVELKGFSTNVTIYKDIKILDGKLIIDGQAYMLKRAYNTQNSWIVKNITKYKNDYDLFIKLLKDFFEHVNIYNNNNWDEYIQLETQKMMLMDCDAELKKMQDISKKKKLEMIERLDHEKNND